MRALALALALGVSTPALADPTPEEIDAVVARAMEAFQVPGLAVGVVKDGKLVFAKGYGVRALGSPEKVDADTLFAIGSNTKPFTTAVLASLVDEGKLGWDDKVVKWLPEFALWDPYVTREITVRDLVTHRSGLGSGAGDLMIFPDTDFSRAEMIGAMKHFKPASGFRAKYAYENVLFIAAGEIAAKAAGESWDDLVQHRILDRLGMAPCATRGSAVRGVANQAVAHAVVEGKLGRVDPVDLTAAGPAGGIQCNVAGMAKWMELQLASGKAPDGGAVFSPRQAREMWTVVTPGPVPPMLTRLHHTHLRGYGLGWNLEDFEGVQRVFHSGGVLGEVSHLTLIPEANLGVVVLTNQQATEATNAVTLYIAKAYLGRGQNDWVALYKGQADGVAAEIAKAKEADVKALAEAGAPPMPLDAYAGTYADPWRGEARVRREGQGLTLAFSRTARMHGRLLHYGKGVFLVRWDDRSLDADALVRFAADAKGAVTGMSLEALPSSAGAFDYQNLDFRKVGARAPR